MGAGGQAAAEAAAVSPETRFDDGADSRKTLKATAEGKVDILIGTHRLLARKLRFQKLGLVVVDEEHSGFERADGSTPPAYHVEPCDGLVVDSAAYKITVPPQYKVDGPNMIHVLMGKDMQYRTAWSTNAQRHTLSAATLQPRPGSKPFRGFRSGDTVIIAIGFDHTGIDPSKPETLSLMWMGMIKIK